MKLEFLPHPSHLFADGSSGGLFPSPELFELVPDVVRHLADFLAPVDALIAAGVCEF
jgi:hypothetical protein